MSKVLLPLKFIGVSLKIIIWIVKNSMGDYSSSSKKDNVITFLKLDYANNSTNQKSYWTEVFLFEKKVVVYESKKKK